MSSKPGSPKSAKRDAGSTKSFCPIDRFIGQDGLFAIPGGAYGQCFRLTGYDPDGRLPSELLADSRKLATALRSLPTEVTLYQYYLSHDGYPLTTESTSPPVVRRTEFLRREAGFAKRQIVWCLRAGPQRQHRQTIALLRESASLLTHQIGNVLPMQPMTANETAFFFSYLLTLDPALATRTLTSPVRVAQQIATQPLCWTKREICIGREYVRPFCLSGWPIGTRPDLLAGIRKLTGNLVLCVEWRRRSTADTRKRLKSLGGFIGVFKRSFSSQILHKSGQGAPQQEETADTLAAKRSTGKLSDIVTELEEGTAYGHFSLTGLVHGRDPQQLEQQLSKLDQVFSDPAEAFLMYETIYGAHDAYEALLLKPAMNHRRRWMRDTHAANLSCAYLPSIGKLRSESIQAEYLVAYESLDRQPFFYDPYTDQLRGLLIVGSPRQGKSVNGNLLVDHEQKYNGFTTIYDKGGAYNATVRSHGGLVTNIGVDGPRFAPWALLPGPGSEQAIFLLVRTLLRKGEYTLGPLEEDMLRKHITALWRLPKESRRLRCLPLSTTAEPHIRKWVNNGAYAHLFDNIEDELAVARLQAFDFEGLDKYPDLLEPILMWIAARKEAQRSDPALLHLPKHDLFDELWAHIQDPQMWQFLLTDLKTGAKKLGGVTMVTHHVADLGAHATLIKNACSHVIFLPTKNLDREQYRTFFTLNEAQLDDIAALTPHHLCLKTPDTWKRLKLTLDPISLALYNTSPRETQLRDALTKEFGHDQAILRMAAR